MPEGQDDVEADKGSLLGRGKPSGVVRQRMHVSAPGEFIERLDSIAVEEPLEIKVQGPGQEPVNIAVTMRTPGHDLELAAGFLWTEGLIHSREDLADVGSLSHPAQRRACNTITLSLSKIFDATTLKRNFFATSSCGICGKAAIEQISVRCPAAQPGPVVTRDLIVSLPAKLREAQVAFSSTGGLHASGLFDADANLLYIREDVGRHNAVDKIAGRALLDGNNPLNNVILLVSGRLSFEIVQKAAVSGIGLVCAVSAPSSLAIATAQRLGVTLVGFLRGDRFNIYSYPGRIESVVSALKKEILT
jgi:FdhD protein